MVAALYTWRMLDRFAPRLRRLLTAALEDAGRRGAGAATAEHLLLAVCRDRESAGVFVFEHAGVAVDTLQQQLDASAGRNGSLRERAGKLDPAALLLLDVANDQSRKLGHKHIGTEHIALAIAQLANTPTGTIVRELGLTPANAEVGVKRWLAAGMPRRRGGFGWTHFRSPLLAKLMSPLQKAANGVDLAYKVFVRRSLGHPRMVKNPYPMLAWLRKHEPVRKDPIAPVWVVTKYDDVMAMLKDLRFKKDPFAADRLPRVVREQLGGTNEARVDYEGISMLFLDPPEHTRVRGVFTKAFTPRTLADLRPRIEQITAKRLDRVAGAGRMDVIADLAYPLPVIVIAELLGFPAEDYEKIKRWSDDFAASLALNASAEALTQASDARGEIRLYFNRIVEDLKAKPADNLLNRLLETENQAGGLNREEIFANCVLLLAAGHETTMNLIGNGVLTLLQHREQWEAIVRDPSLIESAVEEILRYEPPVAWVSRSCGEDIELSGVTVPAGTIVLGSLGAANRDPAVFPSPDRFDIRRIDNKHLGFGSGIHFCLGAALARMEAQIALAALVTRFPRMRLAGTKLQWIPGLTFRGVRKLDVLL